MEQYVIKGGNPLVGEVEIAGAKNAALAILAAQLKEKVWLPFGIQTGMYGMLFYHIGYIMKKKQIFEKNIKEMINNMDDTDSNDFKKFVKTHWNIDARRDSDVD